MSSAVAGPYLPEVAEGDADGGTAALFEQIRGAIGLPVVNLVYRHLATVPGRLEGVWAAIEPNVHHLAAHGVAEELVAAAMPPAVQAVPAAALAAAGVDSRVSAGAEATLAVYGRGNATNLIALTALLRGAAGREPEPPPAAATATRVPELPPMSGPEDFPPSSRALLLEISAVVAGGEEPVIVPSLLRHLVDPPALLALAWTNIGRGMRSAEFDQAARALGTSATTIASNLPYAVPATTDAETRLVLERFLEAIPRALLLGSMLSRSFKQMSERKERHDDRL